MLIMLESLLTWNPSLPVYLQTSFSSRTSYISSCFHHLKAPFLPFCVSLLFHFHYLLHEYIVFFCFLLLPFSGDSSPNELTQVEVHVFHANVFQNVAELLSNDVSLLWVC